MTIEALVSHVKVYFKITLLSLPLHLPRLPASSHYASDCLTYYQLHGFHHLLHFKYGAWLTCGRISSRDGFFSLHSFGSRNHTTAKVGRKTSRLHRPAAPWQVSVVADHGRLMLLYTR